VGRKPATSKIAHVLGLAVIQSRPDPARYAGSRLKWMRRRRRIAARDGYSLSSASRGLGTVIWWRSHHAQRNQAEYS
jgi:hypothetical protein